MNLTAGRKDGAATWVSLIKRRVDLLCELHKLVDHQERLIDASQLDPLLELLGAKQVLLNELEAIERELAAHRQQLEKSPASQAGSPSGDFWQLWEEGRVLAKKLLEREAACEARMLARKAEVAAALRELGTAVQAHQAYQAAIRASAPSGNLVSEA